MDAELPKRAMHLIDTHDAAKALFIMLRLQQLPTRTRPNALVAEPKLANPLTLNVLPRLLKFIIDRLLPIRAYDLIENDEAHVAKLITLICCTLPNRDSPQTLIMLPIFTVALIDKELPKFANASTEQLLPNLATLLTLKLLPIRTASNTLAVCDRLVNDLIETLDPHFIMFMILMPVAMTTPWPPWP
jgi:hypothetical protein